MRLRPFWDSAFGSSNAGRGKYDHIEGSSMPLFEDLRPGRESFPQLDDSADTSSVCYRRNQIERRFFARVVSLIICLSIEQFGCRWAGPCEINKTPGKHGVVIGRNRGISGRNSFREGEKKVLLLPVRWWLYFFDAVRLESQLSSSDPRICVAARSRNDLAWLLCAKPPGSGSGNG